MYGGVGCLGTAIVRSDTASVFATGRTWWQIPPLTRVTFTGTLPAGVTGKDVMIVMTGLSDKDEVLHHAIEFTGSEETMPSLLIVSRLTIATMTTEWGRTHRSVPDRSDTGALAVLQGYGGGDTG